MSFARDFASGLAHPPYFIWWAICVPRQRLFLHPDATQKTSCAHIEQCNRIIFFIFCPAFPHWDLCPLFIPYLSSSWTPPFRIPTSASTFTTLQGRPHLMFVGLNPLWGSIFGVSGVSSFLLLLTYSLSSSFVPISICTQCESRSYKQLCWECCPNNVYLPPWSIARIGHTWSRRSAAI